MAGAASTRIPSTPRSNQKRRMSSNALEHLLVAPVEVGLLDGERVQVPLAGSAVGLDHPLPARATEAADPVVRRLVAPLALAVTEEVAIPFW